MDACSAYERPSCNYFCVGRRQVCRKTGGRRWRSITRVRHGNLTQIALTTPGHWPASPKRNKRNRAKWTLHARRRPLVNVANSLTSPQIPREAAHKRTHSWPDDEEEHRQQHSDGHAADVDAVLPVAPPARRSNVTRRPRSRRDVVPVTALFDGVEFQEGSPH